MKNIKKHLPDKKTQLEVEKKLARLEAFTELNPRPVIEIDFKGNVMDWNASAKEFFPDLKKKGIKHIYLSNLKEVVRSLKNENPFRREIKVGNEWFKQIFYYIPRFKLIHIYASHITESKKVKDTLKENEKRYRLLFEKMNYGYALQDIIFNEKGKPVDYRFVDVNPAFEKISRLKKDFIIGRTANEISTSPKTKENIKNRKQYDQVALTGKPLYLESYNEKLKKYFELYAYRPNEKQIALIFSDITRRKKNEEEKNNFISMMSHELRNPLTPIMANAQFLKIVLQKENIAHPVIKESIEVIENQSTIMAGLLNDILDVSRFTKNKIVLQKSKVNICDLIKNAIKTSMPFIHTKNQKLSVFFNQNPIYLYADPLRIEQIMVNIINNASKYTQPGGYIIVRAGVKNKAIQINVKDNGEGMNAEKIARIFELFNDESQPFMGIGGLGIGLNIVKNLVSMHRGTISVNSKGKNKGSEFIIKFPFQNKNSVSVKNLPPTKKEININNNKKHTKIMVVDDNKDIRNAISKILQLQGHQIKTAHDGLTAIKIAKSFIPDIALIDIGLPDINGYKVAKQLKEYYHSKNKKIKLIAFTGYGQQKDKKLSKEVGFDYHITKPVDINYLIKLV